MVPHRSTGQSRQAKFANTLLAQLCVNSLCRHRHLAASSQSESMHLNTHGIRRHTIYTTLKTGPEYAELTVSLKTDTGIF